jgi:(p)ppGpp synthase/HD superfamily hydrolase
MYSQRLVEAFDYAADLHRDQKKKGTSIPYLAHLLGVASLVAENGGTEDEVIAALLHDAAEDQGGKKVLNEISEQFGDHVASIVLGCSDTLSWPKPLWKTRKKQYLKHLENADDSTILVSIADKLHNLRSIVRDYRATGEDLWDRFGGKKEGTLWYYRTLSEFFNRRGPETPAKQISVCLNELEALMIQERTEDG